MRNMSSLLVLERDEVVSPGSAPEVALLPIYDTIRVIVISDKRYLGSQLCNSCDCVVVSENMNQRYFDT